MSATTVGCANKLPHGGPKRVLVVEDDADLAECMGFLLSDLGYEVYTAGNREHGVNEALRLRPEAVVADLGLPRMVDGLELGRQVRAALPAVRLVALSGHKGVEQQVKASGFDRYLVKPVGLAAVVEALTGETA